MGEEEEEEEVAEEGEPSTADVEEPGSDRPVVSTVAGEEPPPPTWARDPRLPIGLWLLFLGMVRFAHRNREVDLGTLPPPLRRVVRTFLDLTMGGDSRTRLPFEDPRNPGAINPVLLKALWDDLVNFLENNGRLVSSEDDPSPVVPLERLVPDPLPASADEAVSVGGGTRSDLEDPPPSGPESMADSLFRGFSPAERKRLLDELQELMQENPEIVTTIVGIVFPAVGDVLDGFMALVYLLKGEWGNATLAAVSAVPGLGGIPGIALLVKLLAKLFKSANNVRRFPTLFKLFERLKRWRKAAGEVGDAKRVLSSADEGASVTTVRHPNSGALPPSGPGKVSRSSSGPRPDPRFRDAPVPPKKPFPADDKIWGKTKEIIQDDRPLSDLTVSERQTLAKFYDEAAQGVRYESEIGYNQARAAYLRGEISQKPGSIDVWRARNGYPPKPGGLN